VQVVVVLVALVEVVEVVVVVVVEVAVVVGVLNLLETMLKHYSLLATAADVVVGYTSRHGHDCSQ